MTAMLRNSDFVWRGADLYLGRRRMLTLEADATYPHLYRIRYPDGWLKHSGQPDTGEGCCVQSRPLFAGADGRGSTAPERRRGKPSPHRANNP